MVMSLRENMNTCNRHGFDDTEIDKLESIRRYGNENAIEETEYYTLPPKRTDMMKDWRNWRTSINGVMSELIGKKSTGRDTLTIEACMKAPNFFKGTMSIHGQRVKDEYGGKPIEDTDDQNVRVEKKIIDENFFLFGIPRISLQRATSNRNNVNKRDAHRGYSGSRVRNSLITSNNIIQSGTSMDTDDEDQYMYIKDWEQRSES